MTRILLQKKTVRLAVTGTSVKKGWPVSRLLRPENTPRWLPRRRRDQEPEAVAETHLGVNSKPPPGQASGLENVLFLLPSQEKTPQPSAGRKCVLLFGHVLINPCK